MRRTVVRLAICFLWCALGLGWWSGGATAGETRQVSSVGEPSLLGGSLVVPGVEVLDGGQQVLAADRALHASPGAFVARQRSRMEFSHLDGAAVARVARQAFPSLVDAREGGAPALPAGERIRRFSAPNLAQVSLPNHMRGVIESVRPMASRTAAGKLEAIDLSLKDSGLSFVPASSPLAVRIPRHLADGVRAPQSGVSLTPADAGGRALSGSEGSVQGASVIYANTQKDADTLAKPTTGGFELSTILRSQDSPHQFYYRLGLPKGASLIQHQPRAPVQIRVCPVLCGAPG
jgi:hypothetical protein